MSLQETFRDGMIKIASIYIEKYNSDPVGTVQFLKNTQVPVQILGNLYNYLSKDFGPIENLSEEEKKELIKEVGPCESKEKLILLCRSIYIIQKIYEPTT